MALDAAAHKIPAGFGKQRKNARCMPEVHADLASLFLSAPAGSLPAGNTNGGVSGRQTGSSSILLEVRMYSTYSRAGCRGKGAISLQSLQKIAGAKHGSSPVLAVRGRAPFLTIEKDAYRRLPCCIQSVSL